MFWQPHLILDLISEEKEASVLRLVILDVFVSRTPNFNENLWLYELNNVAYMYMYLQLATKQVLQNPSTLQFLLRIFKDLLQQWVWVKEKKIEIVGCTTLTTGYTIIWKNVFKIHPIFQDVLVSHKISVLCNYCKHFLRYQTDNQQVELFQKIGLS